MVAIAVIGGQWGDEGKGKVIDFLCENASVVARGTGGNNAGHTVWVGKEKRVSHLVPSAGFWPGKRVILGNGMVINPDVLIEELSWLPYLNGNVPENERTQIFVSPQAHVIMPYHITLDALQEAKRGADSIGTTGQGIGPAYEDKMRREGVRIGDLLNLEELLPRVASLVQAKNELIEKVYEGEPLDVDEVQSRVVSWARRLLPSIRVEYHISSLLQEAVQTGKLLLEGAQGTLLDIDHGGYPHVTSSNSSIGGMLVGIGLTPKSLNHILGVFKAYATRVGSGVFPTEILDERADKIRDAGEAPEYGSTTNRPRRIGWFDMAAARYSIELNGIDSIALTRLDTLDGFEKIRVCMRYTYENAHVSEYRYIPDDKTLTELRPNYGDLTGWDGVAGVTKWNKLPKTAQSYVRFLEDNLGVPVSIISTGPERSSTIVRHQIF
ncbi:MAG TPA: adenylosuccinate synthase [Candidatus Paceibacterota bacterium]|nr:adenylosuccinate synthase [Candidatus Paceibacterota bacterium]